MPPAPPVSCEIVIPCYKESERLPSFLRALAAELKFRKLPARITVVDDGSGEEEVKLTLAAIAPILAEYPDVIAPPILNEVNTGKGGAVYSSWRKVAQSGAEWLCFADADGSTNEKELSHLIEHAMKHTASTDAVYGSRVKLLGKHVERSWRRHVVGRCFATMASTLTGVEVYDSQCGAKVVRTKAFLAVESLLEEHGFAFDVELTLALLQRGFHIVEVPISWADVPGSKVRMSRDIWMMAQSLVRIRARLGRYHPVDGLKAIS